MLRRLSGFVFALVIFFSSFSVAHAADAGSFIQNLGDSAVSILADKTQTKEQQSETFRAMLRSSFDLPTIGRFVIGRAWAGATPEQQKEYTDLFEGLVIKTYSDRFSLYTGEGFKVRTVRPEGKRDFMVTSEITHPNGSAPTSVDWRVRQTEDKFGVIDVIVEGISMSVTQRQEYAAIVQRDGGKLDGLLAEMRARVQTPSTKK